MHRSVAVGLLLICTAIWGLAFVFQKNAMQHMEPLTFAGARYLLGACLVLPLAIWEYQRVTASGLIITRNQWIRIAVLSLAFFLGVWLQQVALLTTSVTNGGFITSLYVIFTPVVAFLISRTRPHPIIYVGAPLALFGIYLLTGARLDQLALGDLQLFLCAICWGVQVAMLGDLVRETRMPIFVSTINFFATALLSLAGAFVVETPNVEGIAGAWIPIVYSGVGSTAIAFTLQAISQRHVPPANTAIIMSSEALFAAVFGAWLLSERLPLVGYAGAAIIFVAIVLVEIVPALRGKLGSTARESN
jgi:drug/metabolite transporter (DMT)-like permease